MRKTFWYPPINSVRKSVRQEGTRTETNLLALEPKKMVQYDHDRTVPHSSQRSKGSYANRQQSERTATAEGENPSCAILKGLQIIYLALFQLLHSKPSNFFKFRKS